MRVKDATKNATLQTLIKSASATTLTAQQLQEHGNEGTLTSTEVVTYCEEKYKGNAEYLKGIKNFHGGKKLEELPGVRFTQFLETGGENGGRPPEGHIKGVVALLRLAGESNLRVEDATKNATLQTLIKSVSATTLTAQQLQEHGNEGTLTSTDLVTHCEEKYKANPEQLRGIKNFLGGKKLEELPGDWFTQWSETGGENDNKPLIEYIKGVVALLKLAGESNLRVEDASKNANLQTLIKSSSSRHGGISTIDNPALRESSIDGSVIQQEQWGNGISGSVYLSGFSKNYFVAEDGDENNADILEKDIPKVENLVRNFPRHIETDEEGDKFLFIIKSNDLNGEIHLVIDDSVLDPLTPPRPASAAESLVVASTPNEFSPARVVNGSSTDDSKYPDLPMAEQIRTKNLKRPREDTEFNELCPQMVRFDIDTGTIKPLDPATTDYRIEQLRELEVVFLDKKSGNPIDQYGSALTCTVSTLSHLPKKIDIKKLGKWPEFERGQKDYTSSHQSVDDSIEYGIGSEEATSSDQMSGLSHFSGGSSLGGFMEGFSGLEFPDNRYAGTMLQQPSAMGPPQRAGTGVEPDSSTSMPDWPPPQQQQQQGTANLSAFTAGYNPDDALGAFPGSVLGDDPYLTMAMPRQSYGQPRAEYQTQQPGSMGPQNLGPVRPAEPINWSGFPSGDLPAAGRPASLHASESSLRPYGAQLGSDISGGQSSTASRQGPLSSTRAEPSGGPAPTTGSQWDPRLIIEKPQPSRGRGRGRGGGQ